MFELHHHFYDNIDDILEKDVVFTRRTKKGSVSCISSVFDIEATSFYENDEKRGCMYAWVFGINGKCIRGRTWNEFLCVISKVVDFYQTTPKRRFIIYIHNLSYEFQWFKDLFTWEKVFAIDDRKPIYAITTEGIEFRCSYLLSGYSLDNVGNNLIKYKVNKKVGDLNYDLLRTSETPLTDTEWGYILNDGLVVMAYIQEELERVNYKMNKIPLTKTGYVRNLCRDRMMNKNNKNGYMNRKVINALTMTPEIYNQFKRVYMGGFTHANARKVGRVWTNVSSYDFTSSYPSVMCEKFPCSTPKKVEIKNAEEMYEYLDYCCCMFDVTFIGLESTATFEHYISYSKCVYTEGAVIDNGRVVSANKLTISLTELDFKIICKMYKWESMGVANFYYMYKSYLPSDLINTMLDLYENKTTLKGVPEREVDYMVSKGMLNSLYGMCVTDPCKNVITYKTEWTTEQDTIENLIDTYNNNKQRFLYYAWGIWISAYARYNLFTGILECGDDYIYSDTDSIKILNREKHKEYFDTYNANCQEKIKTCLRKLGIDENRACPKTINGVEKPLGVWDFEGTYLKFKTLGAKRYMYTQINSKTKLEELHITISGVSKKDGVDYLLWKYKTNDNILKHFTDKLTFPPIYTIKNKNGEEEIKKGSGKLCHTYIDIEYEGELKDYLGNYGHYHELSCVHLEPTGYDLSLESRFIEYLMGVQEKYN